MQLEPSKILLLGKWIVFCKDRLTTNQEPCTPFCIYDAL